MNRARPPGVAVTTPPREDGFNCCARAYRDCDGDHVRFAISWRARPRRNFAISSDGDGEW